MARTPRTKPAAASTPAAAAPAASPRRRASEAAVVTPPAAPAAAAKRPRNGAAVPVRPGAQVFALPERPAAVPARRRSNRRSEQTIEKILACTETIILESGAERISILDVCRAADVSRGTFYRYFASQDELLDAFARHKRERFHRALQSVVSQHDEPDARFNAIIAYLDHYLEHGNARRLLSVAPEYALGFFKRIFHDSVVRFQDALGIVFDAWELRLGIQIDRELVTELLIRYVLSEQLVPSDADRKSLPRRIGRMVDALLAGAPARARR
ncbi:MAG: TetR/AcrR family transcriptional regulator [Rubrivivax sp.]|nr:TetR/AcrR family transcriptional regulator [Rubrivivax sp.]